MFNPATGKFSKPPGPTIKNKVRRDSVSDLTRDVEGETFEDATLPNIIDTISFVECTFRNCTFTNSSIIDASFKHCSFDNSNFGGAQFENVDYTNCDFGNAGAAKNYTSWRKAKLKNVKFFECNFTAANFSNADLSSVAFEKCRLIAIPFDNAFFVRRASQNVEYTTFCIVDSFCHKLDFSRALLGASNFSGSSFSVCSFRGSDATGAIFSHSHLADVEVSDAILEHADFRGTTFENVNLTEARSWYRAKVDVNNGGTMLKALGFIVRQFK